MPHYHPPLEAMDLALGAVGLSEVLALPPFEDIHSDDVGGVLKGFGRFASEVLAPTDQLGDRHGATFDPDTGSVSTPPPIRDAYQQWVAGGWSGLSVDATHGGGGLPTLVGMAVEEMFASANLALSLNPMLTQGAVHLLTRWGSDEQRATYLPKLVTGEWTGTMSLTEPDAGSDVGAVRSQASPCGDGRWEITGTKIFITWGEHDAAANIIHLVLARTPGAPAGTKGLSLFAVPRNHLRPDGSVGNRNAVRCIGIEHKLGIHASPTCSLEFDRAVGDLVGPVHGGMGAMFTMMNAARLSVGLEGLAVTERAYQQALAYAQQRHQGRTPSTEAGQSVPIIDHPDVRRMLLTMATGIDAMRLLLYTTAAATDAARYHTDPTRQAEAQARTDLLTPIAKAWPTDEGVRLTSIAMQVHGGMGYIEATGIAQRYRDSRIAPIYEGTNGIQAIDLVTRKVRRDRGAALGALIEELERSVAQFGGLDGMQRAADHLEAALAASSKAGSWIVDCEDERDWLAGATPFLDLVALSICGGLLAQQARWADRHRPPETAQAIAERAHFYAIERASLAPALLDAVTTGADRLDRCRLP